MNKTYADKKFIPSLRRLWNKGDVFRIAAEKVRDAILELRLGSEDPFKKFSRRRENRIKDCRKYDIGGDCRLITVVKDGLRYLIYTGNHKDCDKWLANNKGYVPRMDKNGILVKTFESESLNPSGRVGGKSDFSYGRLFEKLQDMDFNFLIDGIPNSIVRKIEALESVNENDDIYEAVKNIEDENRQKTIYDTFARLRQGDLKAAGNRVASFRGDIVSPQPNIEIKDGEDFCTIPTDSPRELEKFEHYIRTADYRDWMMFMHPEQERIATAELAGPTKLSGVSGSGKTCIVVKRAVTLAERYPDGKILVLTLNRPLAGLINDLVLNYCAFPEVRNRIRVMPFFQLCQEFLSKFEPDNDRLYDDQTWKTKEHIDNVWREFYRLELNYRGAECMLPVHDLLISRDIDAECYIREEFDWIRSAVRYNQREDYIDIERSGRLYPLEKRFRELLLQGLYKWEEKMKKIGITDYLGVATALYHHRDKLRPEYRCVLIDECQDFGTIELELVKTLVESGKDNLFLCGDAAQHVSWKHQSFKDAGIFLPGARSMKINKNYRNNRYVLEAAYQILYENLDEGMMEKEDFEILDPKFADFGGPNPLRLEADSLEDEMAYAIEYAKSKLATDHQNHKACIAVCGYSLYQIEEFGKRHSIPVLEGMRSIDKDSLFLSDLEQMKGFEFDLVCIVNTSKEIIPNPATPPREQFRDLSKLYVAMTRAKLELIVSYSRTPSHYIDGNKTDKHFRSGMWADHFPEGTVLGLGKPPTLDQLHDEAVVKSPPINKMTIEQFLYTPDARGVSLRLIKKLRNLVDEDRRKSEQIPADWPSLSDVANEVAENQENARKYLGPDYKEFQGLAKRVGLHFR